MIIINQSCDKQEIKPQHQCGSQEKEEKKTTKQKNNPMRLLEPWKAAAIYTSKYAIETFSLKKKMHSLDISRLGLRN